MPRFSRAEPLVAIIKYRQDDGMTTPAFGIGPGWHYSLAVTLDGQNFSTRRFCLGESEYADEGTTGRGAPLPVTLMKDPPEGFDGDPGAETFDVAEFDIEPADPGECPAFGEVVDGSFDGNAWVDNNTNMPHTIDMVGEGGSRALHVNDATQNGTCATASVQTQISIPAAGTPAISFYVAMTGPAGSVGVSIQRYSSAKPLAGPLPAQTQHFCIPSYMRGSVQPLYVNISACGNAVGPADAVVDSFAIVDDPACADDPTFDLPLVSFGTPDPTVYVTNGVLEIKQPTSCNAGAFAFYVRAPDLTTGGAIGFQYKVTASTVTRLDVFNVDESAHVSEFMPTQDGQWHSGFRCLLPLPTGHDTGIRFALEPVVQPFTTCPQPVTVDLDNLVLTTDPSCPTTEGP